MSLVVISVRLELGFTLFPSDILPVFRPVFSSGRVNLLALGMGGV